ncbi:tetratricopeptide repeat protein [Thermodesulfovibrio sp. 1176]|nr:tetratricopeptide repeat protein [Thermodesulfovibrio sp. 1176]
MFKKELSIIFLFFIFISGCSMPQIVVLKDPLTPEEHLQLGLSYEKKGLIDEAIKHFKEASKYDARGFLFLGNLYFKQNQFDDAEVNFKKAIKKDNKLADAYNNLAWLYLTKNINLDEAEELVKKAIELEKENTEKIKYYQNTLDKIKNLKTK